MSNQFTCCSKQNLKVMNDKPESFNALCLTCGEHWYYVQGGIVQYTRKEWDRIMNTEKTVETIPQAKCHFCGKSPVFEKPLLMPAGWSFDNWQPDCRWCECPECEKPQHPCSGKCTEYRNEQCKNCLVGEGA